MEEFVLPEKWCITRDEENYLIVNEWANTKSGEYFTRNESEVYFNGMCATTNTMHPYPAEIIFEQFKKYVIKDKTISAYRLKDSCKVYASAAIAIDGYDGFGTEIGNGQLIPIDMVRTIDKLMAAGVLDLWFDPVYAIELPEINGYKGEKLSNTSVKYGCVTLSVDVLKKYVQFELLSPNRKLQSITLDSGVNITMEQIKEIIAYCDCK